MHIDFIYMTVFYYKPIESFICFEYYISNGFTYSDLSFLIYQLSVLYYYLAYLVVEIDKTIEAVIKECERKLNEATVCVP